MDSEEIKPEIKELYDQCYLPWVGESQFQEIIEALKQRTVEEFDLGLYHQVY